LKTKKPVFPAWYLGGCIVFLMNTLCEEGKKIILNKEKGKEKTIYSITRKFCYLCLLWCLEEGYGPSLEEIKKTYVNLFKPNTNYLNIEKRINE